VRGLRIPGREDESAQVTTMEGKAIGQLSSAWFDADRDETIALAPLARVVEPPADVLVDGTAARVVELPMPR
jgi:hypothetical protein